MTDKIEYRGFEIYPSMVSYHKSHDWTATHVDYDLDDDRHFVGESVEALKTEIDDWHEDNTPNYGEQYREKIAGA